MAGDPLHSVLAKCDYTSEFSDLESEIEHERRLVKKSTNDLYKKPFTDQKLGLFKSSGDRRKPKKHVFTDELERQEAKRSRYHGLLAMDAFTRHQKFVNDYLLYYGGKREDFQPTEQKNITDLDIIRQNNKFLWEDDSDGNATWEQRLAKKYWDKLFKEYAIADLSRYKENKVALRWRIEKEVVSGKGQFSCGNKHCKEEEGLRSWEVNFAYMELGEKKNALVKLRLCPECSYKLNYYHKKKEVKKLKREKKKKKKDKKSKHGSPDHMGTSKQDNALSSDGKCSEKDSGNEIWSQPVKIEQEKSREEEFDSYFEDMFQ